MKNYQTHKSETRAAEARFTTLPCGRPIVRLKIPAGGGRHLHLEMALGAARAAREVLDAALQDVAAELGDYDPDLAKGRR